LDLKQWQILLLPLDLPRLKNKNSRLDLKQLLFRVFGAQAVTFKEQKFQIGFEAVARNRKTGESSGLKNKNSRLDLKRSSQTPACYRSAGYQNENSRSYSRPRCTGFVCNDYRAARSKSMQMKFCSGKVSCDKTSIDSPNFPTATQY